MRLILSVVLIAALSSIAEYFLPWWSLAIVAFLIAMLLRLSPGKAFLAGFLGIAVSWASWALWRDIPNDHLLAGRLSGVFGLPGGTSFIIVTAVVGGLVGGLAAWSGGCIGERRSVKRY